MHLASFLLPGLSAAAAVLPRDVDYATQIRTSSVHLARQANNNACTTPEKRVEWRALDAATQKQYTDSVLCLMKKPSQLGLNTTRYEDFSWVHAHLNDQSNYILRPSLLPDVSLLTCNRE